jgi:hypothetical protein
LSGKGPSGSSGRFAAGLSVADASEAIGLSRITVLRRVKSGQWPGGRSGRKWLVNGAFVRAVEAGLSSPQFAIEDFAAAWMARGGAPQPTSEAFAS